MSCSSREIEYQRVVVNCPKHGEVAQTIEASHLVKVGWEKFCNQCVSETLQGLGLVPLKEEVLT